MPSAKSPLPEAAVAAVRRFCDGQIPPEHRDEMRVEFSTRGKTITIYETRPPWSPEFGPDWTQQGVAKLKYDSDDRHWRLYYSDSNSRWHLYPQVEPTTRVEALLREIKADPTGIFWG